MQLEYCQRIFQGLSLAGGGKLKYISGCLGTYANPPPGQVQVKASLTVQLCPSCANPGPAEEGRICGLLIAPNRLPRQVTSIIWHWPAPESFIDTQNHTPRSLLQARPEQNPKTFKSGISKWEFWQALDTIKVISSLCGHHLHSNLHTIFRAQPQPEFHHSEGQSKAKMVQ